MANRYYQSTDKEEEEDVSPRLDFGFMGGDGSGPQIAKA